MGQQPRRRDWRPILLGGAMLVPSIAAASDYVGEFTLFFGLPAVAYCNVLLGLLLGGFLLKPRSAGAMLLLPFYALLFLLLLYVAGAGGFLMLVAGRGGLRGVFDLVLLIPAILAFVLVWFAAVYLVRSLKESERRNAFRRKSAWAAIVLAVTISVPVFFDLLGMYRRALYEGSRADFPFMAGYLLLFVLAMVLHGLVLRTSSRRRTIKSAADDA